MKYLITFFLLFSSISYATPQTLYDANLPVPVVATLTINWTAAILRENGDAFDAATELDRYEIYATYPDGNEGVILIPDPLATSYTIDVLQGAGEYKFAIASIDKNGIYSQLSDVVSSDVLSYSPPVKTIISITYSCAEGSVCNFYLNN